MNEIYTNMICQNHFHDSNPHWLACTFSLSNLLIRVHSSMPLRRKGKAFILFLTPGKITIRYSLKKKNKGLLSSRSLYCSPENEYKQSSFFWNLIVLQVFQSLLNLLLADFIWEEVLQQGLWNVLEKDLFPSRWLEKRPGRSGTSRLKTTLLVGHWECRPD